MATKRPLGPFARYGLPAVLFVALGSFGLARFVKGRNEVLDRNSGAMYESEWESMRRKLWDRQQEQPFDLEKEYQAMAGLDLESWKNVPVPRPREARDVDELVSKALGSEQQNNERS